MAWILTCLDAPSNRKGHNGPFLLCLLAFQHKAPLCIALKTDTPEHLSKSMCAHTHTQTRSSTRQPYTSLSRQTHRNISAPAHTRTHVLQHTGTPIHCSQHRNTHTHAHKKEDLASHLKRQSLKKCYPRTGTFDPKTLWPSLLPKCESQK